MDTNKHEFKLTGSWQRRAITLACAFVILLCGCAYSLHPYNTPSVQSLKIVSNSPQRYILRVDDKLGNEQKDYSIGSDGFVCFQVPSLPRGCAVRLFGVIKIADHQPEDVKALAASNKVTDAARMLRLYEKAKVAPPPARTQTPAPNRAFARTTAAAVPPRGDGGHPPGPSEDDDFEAGFNSRHRSG